ncbi:fluoride efflux transporter CrcB [Microbacterium deminutum]|uniref:Fluoride-specific ion channel FluC n=1 Tax=Microbacterium deminutum TaxID=344164 RepID=A0ABP5C1K1_9MICO
MTLGLVFAAAVAGGMGAGLRYLVDAVVIRGREGAFPLGILVVNVTGSLALGILVGLGAAIAPPALVMVVGTGLLGGYTTFSTVSVETALLLQRRRRRAAVVNIVGTLVLALAAAGLGMLIGGAVAALAGG